MARFVRILIAAVALAIAAPGQEDAKLVIEMIGKGFSFAQGPAWAKEGYLIFSDTPANRIFKWVPGGQAAILRQEANGPAGNAFDTLGRLYTCETHLRRITRTGKDGRVEVLAELWEGKKLNAPADLAVSKNDHVYFTDPAYGEQSDHRELDFYGVYHIPPKGPLKLVAKSEGRPNGIALSANGRLLYVTNSDERSVRAFDVDRSGDTSNERVVVSKLDGVPAGIRVSDKGELYIAMQKGIAIYGVDGKLIHLLTLHDAPSNLTFDPDGKTFYVTARGFLYRIHPDTNAAGKL